jgi:hypothetical protein
MRVITPAVVSTITSDAPTSVDPADWVDGSYVVGSMVSRGGTVNKRYISIAAVTIADVAPEADVLLANPKWAELGSTNQWAMFDAIRDSCTVTTTATSMTVTATMATATTSLALLGMSNVTQVVVSSVSPAYSKTFTGVTNSVALFDMPNVTTVVMVFTGTIAPLAVGNMTAGTYTAIGNVRIGAIVDFLNFSSIDRSTYGNANLVKRRGVPKVSYKIFIDKSKIDAMMVLRKNLEAVPAVWSGLDDLVTNDYFGALIVLGMYKVFTFEIDNPIGPLIDLEVEEI